MYKMFYQTFSDGVVEHKTEFAYRTTYIVCIYILYIQYIYVYETLLWMYSKFAYVFRCYN